MSDGTWQMSSFLHLVRLSIRHSSSPPPPNPICHDHCDDQHALQAPWVTTDTTRLEYQTWCLDDSGKLLFIKLKRNINSSTMVRGNLLLDTFFLDILWLVSFSNKNSTIMINHILFHTSYFYLRVLDISIARCLHRYSNHLANQLTEKSGLWVTFGNWGGEMAWSNCTQLWSGLGGWCALLCL